jgi:hypothetical protein
MGQQPAKYFPWPTPYGQSPDSNVLNQAQAAPQAPLNNFLPLNPASPTTPSPTPPTAGSSSGGGRGAGSELSNVRRRFSFLGDNF